MKKLINKLRRNRFKNKPFVSKAVIGRRGSMLRITTEDKYEVCAYRIQLLSGERIDIRCRDLMAVWRSQGHQYGYTDSLPTHMFTIIQDGKHELWHGRFNCQYRRFSHSLKGMVVRDGSTTICEWLARLIINVMPVNEIDWQEWTRLFVQLATVGNLSDSSLKYRIREEVEKVFPIEYQNPGLTMSPR